VLLAGCDGEVISLHSAGHALTLRTPSGIELLMHVGIDTVTLKGEGFHPHVKKGDKVRGGAPLIAFDIDFLATHARSLLTQVVIANPERVTAWQRASGLVAAGKDTLFTVVGDGGGGRASAASGTTVTSEAVTIPNPTGLHARPAAVLASLAKGFQSTVKLQMGDRQANARSVTSIMALEVEHGAKVQVVASGPGRRGRGEQARRRPRARMRRRGLRAGIRPRPRPRFPRPPLRRRGAGPTIPTC
jgi:phosphocarrier protein FPr